MRMFNCLVAAVALLVTAAGSAWAAEVNSNTSSSNGTTTITYTVTLEQGETLRDFHVYPANAKPGQRKKIKGSPVADAGAQGPDHWVAGTSSDGHFWRQGGSSQAQAVTGPATAQFAITIPTSKFEDGLVEWVCTNDNDKDADDGDFARGPEEGDPSTHGPIAAVITPQDQAGLGATTILNMDSTEAGRTYTYCAVGADPADAPDPEACYADFVTWAQQNPIPSGWNLTFDGMTGTTDSDGDTSEPEVTVPNDPSLIDEVFWIVAVVDAEPQGDNPTYKLAGEARLVTITN